MSKTPSHPPGTFCYAELASPDTESSGRFYAGLFGWTRNDRDLGEFGVYTQFSLEGHVAAAQYRIPPDQLAAGASPHWCQYVSVRDADAAATRAAELGADVVTGPVDVMDYGRMVVLRDPQGAYINLWQPRGTAGLGVLDEPGAPCWNELMTHDVEGSGTFYADLFGWVREGMDGCGPAGYTIWSRGGARPAGGMLAITPAMGRIPPRWLLYFQVADPDRASAHAAELGGQVLVPPTDIPDAGRFALIQDPVGAEFGVYLSRR